MAEGHSSGTLEVTVVSPARPIFEGEAKFVTAPAWDRVGGHRSLYGGAPKEHAAYGIEFPDVAERVARLEEAVAVIRALWTGGPVTRPSPYYPLVDAHAFPVPTPPPPIIIGGETPAGARLAARIGDGWSTFENNFVQNMPLYLEALEAAGRRREDQRVYAGFQGYWLGDESVAETEWCREPRAAWERWHDIGADGAIVLARTTADVDALVDAVSRW